MDDEKTEVRRTAQTSASLSPGTVLGAYRLDSPLASGATSELYDATNLVARKACVVKVFRRELGINQVRWGRYVHEAKQVGAMGNPNVAEVYGFAHLDGMYFSVMERVDGSSLRSLVRKNAPLSRRTLLPLLRGLCVALAGSHAHGLAHQRLHGGQIVLQWRGTEPTVRILDFGTHHLVPGAKEETGEWVRRPELALCISPEQAKGGPGDARSDVYALSVILYEMVTGKVPFLGDTFAATVEQHLSETPVAPGKIVPLSPDLEETILRGLEKDPRHRIPSVEALLATLDPAAVTGQHALPRSITSTGRHPALALSASREIELSSLSASTEPSSDPSVARPPIPPLARSASVEIAAGEALAPGFPSAGFSAISSGLKAPELRVPRSRTWLWVVLGAAVLLCGGAVAWLLAGGDDEPKAGDGPTTARPGSRRASQSEQPVLVRGRNAAATSAASGLGTLEVITGDEAGQLFVDNKLLGQGRSVTVRLTAGRHRVHVMSGGKKSREQEVFLNPDEGVRLVF